MRKELIAKMRIELNITPPKSTGQSGKKLTTIGGHAAMFETAESKSVKAMFYALLKDKRPAKPFSGGIRVNYYYVFPYLKSMPKKLIKQKLVIPKTTKPDYDNMPKQIQDVMTKLGFWTDDAIIFDGDNLKCYYETPKIVIDIQEVSANDLTNELKMKGII